MPVEQVLAFRAQASHLDAKLAAGSYAQATHAGLQDSVPRAGLIGLHARMEGVHPSDWDHPSLCQIWFRGGADYIIPRTDIAPFTLGTLPRDPVKRAAIEHSADRVVEFLAGRELKTQEVNQGVGFPDHMAIRQTSRSGRVLIRWNASTIFAYECERPDVDEEDARLELTPASSGHWRRAPGGGRGRPEPGGRATRDIGMGLEPPTGTGPKSPGGGGPGRRASPGIARCRRSLPAAGFEYAFGFGADHWGR